MGKAKRQLIAARKECMEEKNAEKEAEIILEKAEQNSAEIEERQNQVKIEKIADTTIKLRSDLLRYADENALSICEHLNRTNVYNFIEWVLSENY